MRGQAEDTRAEEGKGRDGYEGTGGCKEGGGCEERGEVR